MFKLPQYTWDKDRELCKQCKHYRPSIDRPRLYSGALVMRCAVNPFTASKGIGTCIDNRTRGPCGKEGLLFSPAEIGHPVKPEPISFGQKAPQG